MNEIQEKSQEKIQPPLKWLGRFKVEKEEKHVAYFDLYEDTETKKQYFGTKDNLILREGKETE